MNKPFRPTKRMVALIRIMAETDGKPTITEWCEKAGINRGTYYLWFEKQEFVEWFNKEWQQYMERSIPYLDTVGLRKAVKDYRYWEGMQMKYGKFSKKADITSGEEPIKLIIGNANDRVNNS